MKKVLLISLFLFQSLYAFSQKNNTVPDKYEAYQKMLEKQPYHKLLTGNHEEQPNIPDWQKRVEFERLKTLDPATGEIPAGEMEKAREFVEKSLQKAKTERKTAGIPNVKWKEVGPTNVGGRTRGIMYDPNDATRSKVWSGGVSGGLWYNDNIRDANSGWNKVDDFWENLSVSCLEYDPSNPKIFYAATGEIAVNLINEVVNLWKSEDAGKTWKKLPNRPLGTFYINRIVVNKSGEVFVATSAGLQKSVDGGITWKTVLAASAGSTTDMEMANDQIIYVANNTGKIYRSDDASGNQWTEITPPINTARGRTELGLALSTQGDKQVIYAYNNLNWFQKSVDAGKSWENVSIPIITNGKHFVGDQGEYDLIITVHPTNPDIVYANGIVMSKTIDGGKTWDVNENLLMHPDHHNVVFNDKNNDEVIFCNDGGVYYSADAGKNVITRSKIGERNKNYNTTQFYSLAIRNVQNDEIIIGGTQDNGSWKVSNTTADFGKKIGFEADGGYCFIDEDNPDIMIGSYQEGVFYKIDRNNLNYQNLITNPEGAFINPADYDSKSNTLFANVNSTSKIRRVNLNNNISDFLELNINIEASPSAFKTTQNNTLFLGTYEGKIFKVTGVNNAVGNTQKISTGQLPAGYIRNIDVGANENELLVTYSNYSISSVWYTNDGGKNWINKDVEGYRLPNIPVNWAVFNPNNRKQVLLATDLGVWSTNDITANNPAWEVSNSGLANVRCDMIKYRASDGFVAVATYGRGLFSSYAFAPTSISKKISVELKVGEIKNCTGGKISIPFTTTGNFNSNEEYSVYLSDETGSFNTELLIGKGFQSPIVCNLPKPSGSSLDLLGGSNYKVKVVANQSLISSSSSESIVIGSPIAKILGNVNSVCSGSSAILSSNTIKDTYSYQWKRNGIIIPNATFNKIEADQEGLYTLDVTEQGCTNSSSSYNLNVGFIDNPYVQAPITSTCEGLKIAAKSENKTDYFIQWQKDGVDIPNANTPNLDVIVTGQYSVSYKQGQCKRTSDPITLTIGKNIPAQISVSIKPGEVFCKGTTQSLSSIGTYPNERIYQWQKDGKDIPNANSNYYETKETGNYALRVAIGKCVTTSQALKVNFVDSLKTDISTDNNITKMCKGGRITLISSYQPYYNAIYTWKKNGVEIGTSYDFKYDVTESGLYSVSIQQASCKASSGTIKIQIDTTSSLPLKLYTYGYPEVCTYQNGIIDLINSNLYPSDLTFSWQRNGIKLPETPNRYWFANETGSYTLTAQKDGCKGVSEPFIFKVGNTLSAPVIENRNGANSFVEREKLTNCDGLLTVLNSQYNRYSFFGTFQWQKDGKDILNETNTSYNVKEAGSYTLSIKSGNCSAISQPFKVNYITVPKEIIPNTTQGICSNSTTPTILSAVSSDKDLVYQWKRNGFVLEGEVSNNLNVSKEGSYQFVVNRGLCSSVSDEVKVVVDPTQLPKAIISLDNNSVACSGQSIKLTANKEAGLTYQWLKDGKKINLAINDTLRVTEDGKYSVITDNGKCKSTSEAKSISFIKLPNQVSPTASEQSFCEKSFLLLSAVANGDTSVKYQWKRNNENIALATTNNLKITQEGNYQLVATKSGCITVSPAVNVKMTALPKSEITTTNNLTTLCVGDNVVLNGNKEDGIVYQWKKDSINIDKANAQNLQVSKSGKYSLVTSRNDCPTTSNTVNIFFNDKPTASISGGATLYLSESSPLKIDLTSLAPWTIKISDGKEYTANSTPYSVNVTPTDTNAYTITSIVNRCGVGVSKGVVKFKILTPLANEPTLLNEPVLLASSPNPFNESCTIKYGLPKPSNVRLVLYDNQGTEKMILVDEKKASGWHIQNLTSKSLSVGSYILRLEVNGQVFSQKIMLVAE